MESIFLNACAKGNCKTVVHLLEMGIDVNCRDDGWVLDITGVTALMWASLFGHTKIVSLLIDAGATLDMQDNEGFTALMHACGRGYIKIIRLLLDKRANPNLQTIKGNTALVYAINKNHTEIARILINVGANVNHCTKDEHNVFHYAKLHCPDIIPLLLEKGAMEDLD